jgi:hypothetical protein
MEVRPSIKRVAMTTHFKRDLKDESEITLIIDDILDCSHMEFHELHKFQKSVEGNLIFRAKKRKEHIVYAVDKIMRIVFLRAIRNFAEYRKFLENDKEMLKLIANAQDIQVKTEIIDETADNKMSRVDDRKKARLRTRGPYRKTTTRFDS